MKTSKEQTTIALKKARSSIDKIIKMIEEDKYCIDILHQVLAVQGLLRSSSEKILADHLNSCFVDGIKNGKKEKQQELIEELMNVLKLSNRSK